MASRLQLAVIKQLERQVKNQKRRDNRQMFTALRHKMQQHKLVEDHFEEREFDIVQKFGTYREMIENSAKINEAKFVLCLNDRVNKILDEFSPAATYAFDNDEFNNINKKIFAAKNDTLFFKNLYSMEDAPNGDPQNNDKFYMVIFFTCVVFAEVLKTF